MDSQWRNMRIEALDYDNEKYPGLFRRFWSEGGSGVPSDLNGNQKKEIENILENYNPLEKRILNTIRKQI